MFLRGLLSQLEIGDYLLLETSLNGKHLRKIIVKVLKEIKIIKI